MATTIQQSQGFSMPSWTYQNQEPMNVLGAIDAGLNLSNKVMDQPNIKRGRKVQAMQQEKVLSGEMPITMAQAGPDGMVTGKFQDGLTYELERALDSAKVEEGQASAEYRRAQAAAVGPQSQSVIDLNNARAQAALGGGIFGAEGDGIEIMQVPDGQGGFVDQAFVRRKTGLFPVTLPKASSDSETGTELTPGQKSLDQAVGKEYADYVASGGASTAVKNINQVKSGIDTLGRTNEASGAIVGNLPEWARRTITPTGMSAQDDIQGAIMTSLRQVLGAQFTQKEGERLMAQTYDPRAPEEENIRRAQRLVTQLEGALVAKDEAMRYFEEKGTMVGFQGKIPTMADFDMTTSGGTTGATERGTGVDPRVAPPRQAAATAPQTPASIPTVTTREEVNALPSGTQFIGPDGVVRVKR